MCCPRGSERPYREVVMRWGVDALKKLRGRATGYPMTWCTATVQYLGRWMRCEEGDRTISIYGDVVRQSTGMHILGE